MKTITNHLLAGLLRSAYERGYMEGAKGVVTNEGAVPVTAEGYRDTVRAAGNNFLELYYPQLLSDSASSQQLKVEESAEL